MPTITDFNEWLDSIGLNESDFEFIHNLYNAVQDKESCSPWIVQSDVNKTFVRHESADLTLALLSETALQTFLTRMIARYCDDFDDIDSWYGYMRNMSNPNA